MDFLLSIVEQNKKELSTKYILFIGQIKEIVEKNPNPNKYATSRELSLKEKRKSAYCSIFHCEQEGEINDKQAKRAKR